MERIKTTGILLLSLLLVFSVFSIVNAEEVRNPDSFVYVNISDVNTLDPHFAYDTASGEVIYQVYENLIAYKGSSVQEFKPLLSTKVPSVENGLLSKDGKTYTFPIRQGVTFSNGNPLTPEDVKYTFLRAMINDRAGGPVWMLYQPLTGLSGMRELSKDVVGVKDPSKLTPEQSEKVYAELEKHIEIDGNNVIFHLANPYPPFLNILSQSANWSAIIDKEWSIEQGAWDASPKTIANYFDPAKEKDPLYDKMMGTGPFVLNEWENGDHVIFGRNENYWREPANFKTVVIKYVDEFSTRKLMLQRGDADMIYTPLQYVDQVKGLDGVTVQTNIPKLQNSVGIMNWKIVTKGNEGVGSGKLDGKGIPANFFSDINVRKAFANSFNYKAYINQILKGQGMQLRGPIVNPLLGFSKDQPVYHQDLAKAKEYFKKAFDGQLWDKGFEMTIYYNSGNDQRKTACDILKTYIGQINPKFKIHVRGVQWSTYLDKLLAGKFTLGFLGWVADFPDPHNWVEPFLKSDGTYGAYKGQPYIEYAEKNFDPMIAKGIATVDKAKRKAIYTQMQKKAFEDVTDLWLTQPADRNVRRSWVKGWYPNSIRPGQDFYSLSKE